MSTQVSLPGALKEHSQIRAGCALQMRLKTDYHPIKENRYMPNPIQAVIFDQDGLMFDTESLAATSWFEVGPKYGIHVDGKFLLGIRWGCKP